ncbi:MAG: hypothetical protein ACE5IH_07580 [Thermodesulfobacteriota bacterium]
MKVSRTRRILITILDEEAEESGAIHSFASPTALLSEQALARDWDRPEEDKAWSHLQQER